ncbi:Uncharacterized protein dnm_060530 [Desulfonema magnum]|uniref:Uncharacterized protein n=1 Tax=Desulfonema magnum TaxID=45655 RepID=A0A975BQZ5_9BACT|nr:Uncharacterized protein dnm_060530 [Desulfonema magnum]
MGEKKFLYFLNETVLNIFIVFDNKRIPSDRTEGILVFFE